MGAICCKIHYLLIFILLGLTECIYGVGGEKGSSGVGSSRNVDFVSSEEEGEYFEDGTAFLYVDIISGDSTSAGSISSGEASVDSSLDSFRDGHHEEFNYSGDFSYKDPSTSNPASSGIFVQLESLESPGSPMNKAPAKNRRGNKRKRGSLESKSAKKRRGRYIKRKASSESEQIVELPDYLKNVSVTISLEQYRFMIEQVGQRAKVRDLSSIACVDIFLRHLMSEKVWQENLKSLAEEYRTDLQSIVSAISRSYKTLSTDSEINELLHCMNGPMCAHIELVGLEGIIPGGQKRGRRVVSLGEDKKQSSVVPKRTKESKAKIPKKRKRSVPLKSSGEVLESRSSKRKKIVSREKDVEIVVSSDAGKSDVLSSKVPEIPDYSEGTQISREQYCFMVKMIEENRRKRERGFTNKQCLNILLGYLQGVSQTDLGKQYGCLQSTIRGSILSTYNLLESDEQIRNLLRSISRERYDKLEASFSKEQKRRKAKAGSSSRSRNTKKNREEGQSGSLDEVLEEEVVLSTCSTEEQGNAMPKRTKESKAKIPKKRKRSVPLKSSGEVLESRSSKRKKIVSREKDVEIVVSSDVVESNVPLNKATELPNYSAAGTQISREQYCFMVRMIEENKEKRKGGRKFTSEQYLNILLGYLRGVSQTDLGKQYGCLQSTIWSTALSVYNLLESDEQIRNLLRSISRERCNKLEASFSKEQERRKGKKRSSSKSRNAKEKQKEALLENSCKASETEVALTASSTEGQSTVVCKGAEGLEARGPEKRKRNEQAKRSSEFGSSKSRKTVFQMQDRSSSKSRNAKEKQQKTQLGSLDEVLEKGVAPSTVPRDVAVISPTHSPNSRITSDKDRGMPPNEDQEEGFNYPQLNFSYLRAADLGVSEVDRRGQDRIARSPFPVKPHHSSKASPRSVDSHIGWCPVCKAIVLGDEQISSFLVLYSLGPSTPSFTRRPAYPRIDRIEDCPTCRE